MSTPIKVTALWDRKKFNKWMDFAGPNAKKQITLAVRKIAFKILRDAKLNAPVRTGALKASGRVVKINSFTSEVVFGGGGTGVNYSAAVEYGTGSKSGKPYLRPAVLKNEPYARNLIKVAMQKAQPK